MTQRQSDLVIFEFDFHIHSKYSFDGIMTPSQIIKIAKRRGLSGIAVTDHNTVRGGLEAFEINRDPNFLVIVGSEIETEVGDILGLFVKEEIKSKKSHDVIDSIREQGGIAILPHPFSHHRNLNGDLLARFVAIEIHNGRDKGDYSSRIRNELALPHKLTMIGNSDAHLYWEIGGVRNRVEINNLCAQDVREAIVQGQCQVVQFRKRRSITAVYLSKFVKYARRVL